MANIATTYKLQWRPGATLYAHTYVTENTWLKKARMEQGQLTELCRR